MSTKHTSEKAEAAMLIAILVILAALTSCKPVEYKELAAPSIDSNLSMSLSGVNDGTNIYITIPAVNTARSYGYTIDNGTAEQGPVIKIIDTEFSNGTYVLMIPSADVDADASLTFWASPSAEPSASSWVKIGTVSSIETAPDISVEPEGYMAEREETSAVIIMRNEPVPSQMIYKVIEAEGKEIEYSSDLNVITISGLNQDETYTIEIFHAYRNEPENFGNTPLSLDIPAYDSSVILDIAETSAGDGIEIRGSIESLADMKLVNLDTGNEYSMEESSFIFPSFDSGLFQVEAKSGRGIVKSNMLHYTAPIGNFIQKETEKAGCQHYWFDISVADGIAAEDFNVSVRGMDVDVDASSSNGIVSFIVSGLPSAHSDIAVLISYKDEDPYRTAIMTDDFEGTYSFNGDVVYSERPFGTQIKQPDFRFSVDARLTDSDKSQYRYYFYISPDDPKQTLDNGNPIVPEKTRICPLIDPAVDGDAIGNSERNKIDYTGNSSYQIAYQWNNEKWNKSTYAVESWYVVSTEVKNDSYAATVSSRAMGTDNQTKTEFHFEEDEEGNVYLVYRNEITGGLGAMFGGNDCIVKNANPASGDDKYTFRLYPQEEN